MKVFERVNSLGFCILFFVFIIAFSGFEPVQRLLGSPGETNKRVVVIVLALLFGFFGIKKKV